jgi:hypothetical protein
LFTERTARLRIQRTPEAKLNRARVRVHTQTKTKTYKD